MKRFFMKAMRIWGICMLLWAILAAGAAAEEDPRYIFRIPDEITVGRDQAVRISYDRDKESSPLSQRCSSPTYVNGGGSTGVDTGDHYRDTMVSYFHENGTYTLTFYEMFGTYSRDITVHVVDGATGISVSKKRYIMQKGETIDLGLKYEGGLYWGLPAVSKTHRFGKFSEDGTTFTANASGYDTAGLSIGSASVSFEILIVDPCEGIRLSVDHGRGAVGYNSHLITRDKNGNDVCAVVEITEGADRVDVFRNDANYFFTSLTPGYVTFKAYGTDGSTDTLRVRIFPAPESMTVDLASEKLAAGSSEQVSVSLPEGTWYPTVFGLWGHQPADEAVEGPVAAITEDGRITALMPGTCTLEVSVAGMHSNFPLTVTGSRDAIVIGHPDSGFDWRQPYQLTVTRGGQTLPAVFSTVFPYFSVTKDGLLTAEEPDSIGKVTVRLEDGTEYQVKVRSVYMPAWLEPVEEGMVLPLDIVRQEICEIDSDVPLTPVFDLVLCSDNEEVLKTDGMYLVPQSAGEATVTVWSRYCDTMCLLPVIVTEPMYGMLYVDGRSEGLSLNVPYNAAVPLPQVTDYYGNPVKVTWSIASQVVNDGTGKKECVQLATVNSVRSVKGVWGNGVAQLVAKDQNGAQLSLTAFPYFRATDIGFVEEDQTIRVGEWVQLDITYSAGSNGASLYTGDVTYTLSGDTGCVLAEPQFSYYRLTALRPGTVTLTARLYNGKTASVRVTVTDAEGCENGHDPVWRIVSQATASQNGLREKYCSRCFVPLGQEAIPCTGTLRFEKKSFYINLSDPLPAVYLGINVDGDHRQSFTCVSSDPSVVTPIAGVAVGLQPGTATLTVRSGDCAPAVCTVHVAEHDALILPEDLIRVEESAFENNASVTHVVIPEGVRSIGSRAFAGCSMLKEVTIPKSVTSIASDAFEGCKNLTIRCVPGSTAAAFAEAHGFSTAE